MKIVFTLTALMFFSCLFAQTDTVYTDANVQISPQFPGGPDVWQFYLKKYGLKPAKDSSAQTAVVAFTVGKDRGLTDIKLMNADKIDQKLISRVVKAMQEMSGWMPAINNGQNVACRTIKFIQSIK